MFSPPYFALPCYLSVDCFFCFKVTEIFLSNNFFSQNRQTTANLVINPICLRCTNFIVLFSHVVQLTMKLFTTLSSFSTGIMRYGCGGFGCGGSRVVGEGVGDRGGSSVVSGGEGVSAGGGGW